MKACIATLSIVLAASLLIAAPAFGQQTTTYSDRISRKGSLEIVRNPAAADYSYMTGQRKLSALPARDASSAENWQVDVRSRDLSGLDLRSRLDDLLYADFDGKTIWPAALPSGFDPRKISELGKNPGLGLRALHARGITGAGVGIAIIDQALLTTHSEYRDRLRSYEEIHWPNGTAASMHGPAVASIAAGKSVGVAPGADLYFIACWPGEYKDETFEYDLSYIAESIDRIVKINSGLPKGRKIKVISISLGFNSSWKNFNAAEKAIKRAAKKGITTVYVDSAGFLGLGRPPMADPDAAASYEPGLFWKTSANPRLANRLLVPMDSRCVAGPLGSKDYAFYRAGGMSWAVPYAAGLYALACQRKPGISFEAFWKALSDSSSELRGEKGVVGRIVDPAGMIALVDAQK